MEQAAQEFVGRHDFKRFCKAEGKSSEKTIDSIVLTRLGDMVVIDLKGREFLRNMVRRIVAALSPSREGAATIAGDKGGFGRDERYRSGSPRPRDWC